MLSLDTAYRSFGGEVEASSTPTICRLPDSRRHQLSAIARSRNRAGLRPQSLPVGDLTGLKRSMGRWRLTTNARKGHYWWQSQSSPRELRNGWPGRKGSNLLPKCRSAPGDPCFSRLSVKDSKRLGPRPLSSRGSEPYTAWARYKGFGEKSALRALIWGCLTRPV